MHCSIFIHLLYLLGIIYSHWCCPGCCGIPPANHNMICTRYKSLGWKLRTDTAEGLVTDAGCTVMLGIAHGSCMRRLQNTTRYGWWWLTADLKTDLWIDECCSIIPFICVDEMPRKRSPVAYICVCIHAEVWKLKIENWNLAQASKRVLVWPLFRFFDFSIFPSLSVIHLGHMYYEY